jgi:hypothetical protein
MDFNFGNQAENFAISHFSALTIANSMEYVRLEVFKAVGIQSFVFLVLTPRRFFMVTKLADDCAASILRIKPDSCEEAIPLLLWNTYVCCHVMFTEFLHLAT